jgi:hypothetical protein
LDGRKESRILTKFWREKTRRRTERRRLSERDKDTDKQRKSKNPDTTGSIRGV